MEIKSNVRYRRGFYTPYLKSIGRENRTLQAFYQADFATDNRVFRPKGAFGF